MEIMQLKASHKRFLKSLGHNLKPIVCIGRADLTENIINAVNREIENHELIKIKVQSTSTAQINTATEAIAEQINCTILRIIGNTALLYKRNADNPIILLP